MVLDGDVAGPLLTTERSALVDTVVAAVDVLFVLFGSAVVELTFAVLVMVEPLPAPAETCTVMVNVALALAAKVAMLHETVEPVVQVKAGPVFCISETNVVLAGRTSLHDTLTAFDGPALATVMV